MPDITFEPFLQITSYRPKAKIKEPPDVFNIPIHSFEVDGGADRKIDFSATSEFKLASEFEQARAYTNLVFYILPTKDFLAVRLIKIAQTKGKHFNLNFSVSVNSDGTTVRVIRLISYAAKFLETPLYIAGEPPLLKAKVRLLLLELTQGQVEEKSNVINMEKM